MTNETLSKPLKSRTRMAAYQHRVLIYATCYNVIDGVTLTVRKLEHEILRAGHYVCILTTRSGSISNTDIVGSHPNRQVIFIDSTLPIPFLHDPEHPELTYQVGFALSSSVRRQLDEFEPSVVHLTVPDCTTIHILQYARKKEIPVMATFHSNIPEYMDHYPGLSFLKIFLAHFFRHQYNFVQALYVPTPYIKRHLIDTYDMELCTSLKVWGRGVDIVQFNPCHRSQTYRRNLGIADDICIILWVGRLVPEKRPDIFGSVVRRLHDRGLKFHALVVGAGPCEKDVLELPNTTFLGWMDVDQLSVVYASSDIFLFPSAVETFGNVTLEAAASGLPVVVEAGCSGHLVNVGQNGYKIDAGDEESFFEATLSLVLNTKLRDEYRIGSRQLALKMEKSVVVQQMLANYSDVTDEFYADYGGHHHNRDTIYSKPGSFLFGKLPRPFVWLVFEKFFMCMFYLLWYVGVVFSWLFKSPTRQDTNSRDITRANESEINTQSTLIAKNSAFAIVGMDEIEIGAVSSDCDSQKDDDCTSNTTPSVEVQTPLSSSSQLPGDWRVSHNIAIGVVKILQIQCRLESNIRSMFSNGTTHKWQGIHAKRKNSSFIAPSDSCRSRLLDDSVSVMDTIIDEPTIPNVSPCNSQDNRIMRRNQGILAEAFP